MGTGKERADVLAERIKRGPRFRHHAYSLPLTFGPLSVRESQPRCSNSEIPRTYTSVKKQKKGAAGSSRMEPNIPNIFSLCYRIFFKHSMLFTRVHRQATHLCH